METSSTIRRTTPRNLPRLGAVFSLLFACACATATAPTITATEQGLASWYGQDFHGRLTSSGDRYSMYLMTAASRTIPLGSTVRVTRVDTGKSVLVTVNDRGPFVGGRILDLSYEAARRLDMIEKGVSEVRLEVLGTASGTAVAAAARPASPPPTASRPASPKVASSASGQLWISLGTFSMEHQAVWVRDGLATRLPGLTVQPVEDDGERMFRLRVGPFSNPASAQREKMRVDELGFRGSLTTE